MKQLIKQQQLPIVFIAYLIAVSIFYWNFPMLFQVDADSYLQSASAIAGFADISTYSGIRGIGISAIVAFGIKLFGIGAFSVQFSFFLVFLGYAATMLALFNCLGLFKVKYKYVVFVFFALITVTNPLITTYSHFLLTEFPTIAIVALYITLFIKQYKKSDTNSIKKVALAVGFSILIYTIKQVAFLLPLIILVSFELISIIKKIQLKSFLTILFSAVLCIASVFGYIRIWNLMPFVSSVEGDSISSYAGSFIIDGLRYFSPEKRGTFDESIKVSVRDDTYEKEIDKFDYVYKTGLGESIKYLGKCLSVNTERVLKGYYNNFQVICGVKNVIAWDFNNRAHAPVSISSSFFNGWENQAFLSTFCTGLGENYENYDYLSSEFLRNNSQQPTNFSAEKYYNSPITKIGLNNVYNRFSLFSYSFISFCSLVIFIASAIVIWFKRKKQTLLLEVASAFSLSAFVYLLFLVITAQNIDRYGVVVLMMNTVIIFNIAYLAFNAIVNIIKNKSWRKLLKIINNKTKSEQTV